MITCALYFHKNLVTHFSSSNQTEKPSQISSTNGFRKENRPEEALNVEQLTSPKGTPKRKGVNLLIYCLKISKDAFRYFICSSHVSRSPNVDSYKIQHNVDFISVTDIDISGIT